MLYVHTGMPHRGNSNVYPQHVTEFKETFFKYTLKQVSSPLSLPLLNCRIKIYVALPQIVYICMAAISQNSNS